MYSNLTPGVAAGVAPVAVLPSTGGPEILSWMLLYVAVFTLVMAGFAAYKLIPRREG